MKAVRIHGYGDRPAVEDIPTPEPGPDQVLVRVEAASLNPLDLKLQQGFMHGFYPLEFPYTVGTDFAGTIERVGSKVSGWHEGDKIVARNQETSGGGLAEYAVISADLLAKVPTSVPIASAAGLPTVAGTAWQALFEVAQVKPNHVVLVHGGAGGVGSFAVQYARAAGAKVIATASGPGVEIARKLGANEVVDYETTDFTQAVSNVDFVLDTVGGETQQRSYTVLRPGGTLIATPSPPDEDAARERGVNAVFVVHSSDASRLKRVVDDVDRTGTTILVDRTVALDAIDEAVAHLATGHAHGKILFAVS